MDKPGDSQLLERALLPRIREQRWQYARTYDQTAPHEYILMPWNEDLFREIAKYIELYGKDEYFYRTPFRYGYIGKYKYWHYSTFAEDSVMNRTRIDGYDDDLRAKYMHEKYVSGKA